VQDLFTSVYTADRVYNMLFRQEIQNLIDANTEQLRIGKSFYDAVMRVSISSAASKEGATPNPESEIYLTNEKEIVLLLQPFIELASKQLRGICELHLDELTRWLALPTSSIALNGQDSMSSSAPGSGGVSSIDRFSSFPLSPQQPPPARGEWLDANTVCEPQPPFLFATALTVGFLSHIGRVNEDLAFLAKLAETGESCSWQSRAEHTSQQQQQRDQSSLDTIPQPHIAQVMGDEVLGGGVGGGVDNEEFSGMGVRDFFAQLLPHLGDPQGPFNHAPLLGTWEMADKQNFEAYGRFLAAIGYVTEQPRQGVLVWLWCDKEI
jgi:hypothetical protein